MVFVTEIVENCIYFLSGNKKGGSRRPKRRVPPRWEDIQDVYILLFCKDVARNEP